MSQPAMLRQEPTVCASPAGVLGRRQPTRAWRSLRLGLLLMLVGSAMPSWADVGLKACRSIADGDARLACYDRLADAAPAAGSALPSAAPSTAAPAALAAAADRFGLPAKPVQEAGGVEIVVSRLTGAFDGWVARQRFRLANGQVWEIADGSEAFYRLDSPKVEISRGTFGTFFMAVEGVSQVPRVRRIE